MAQTPRSRAAILLIATLLAVAPFFYRGNPSGHDFEFHVYSWMEVQNQWHQGILYPRWAALAHWGYGEARFLFYPPASWTSGAALGAVLPWKMVPGAYCWLALTLAGAAMYRLARGWLSPADALFAAILFALNPYHLLIVYWRSAYAELLASALLPLLLLYLLRLKNPGLRPTLGLSLTLTAAWLTNAPAAVMIQYSAAGIAIVLAAREIAIHRRWGREVSRILMRTAAAFLGSIALAAFYLIPTIYEQSWINLEDVLSPGVRPIDNFLFTIIADPEHNKFNLLTSVLAVAEITVLILAIWFSYARFRVLRKGNEREGLAADPWLPLSLWGAASAIFMLSFTNFFWQHLPKFRFVQLPFRWLLCLNAALAMLVAMATKRWYSRVLVCAVLLAALIVSGYRIQPPWWATAADIREMTNAISDGTGYEGSDEYVPAGADASELNKDLTRFSDRAGAAVSATILNWSPTEKHFLVPNKAGIHGRLGPSGQAKQGNIGVRAETNDDEKSDGEFETPQGLIVRLFNYPAWQVSVNGKRVQQRSTAVTHLIIVPLSPGDNDVRISFRTTSDRQIGTVVSLLAAIVFIFIYLRARQFEIREGSREMSAASNPAA